MNSIRYVSYGGADDPPKEEDKPPEFTDEDAKQEQDSSFSSMWVVDVPNVGAPTDINKDVAVQSLIDKYETSGKKGVVEKLSSVSVNAVKSSGTGLFNRIATGIRQGADNFQKFSRTMNEAAKYATGRGKYVGDILSEIRGKRRGLGSSSSGTSRTVRANVRNVRGRIVGAQGQKGKKTKKLIGKENQRCVTDNNCGDPINLFCYREIDNSSHGICKRRNCYIYKKPNYCGKTHLCLPKDPTMPFIRKTFGIGSDINAQQIRNKHLGEQPTREKSKATQDIVKYLIKLKNYKFQIQTKYNEIFENNNSKETTTDVTNVCGGLGDTFDLTKYSLYDTKDKYFKIQDNYKRYSGPRVSFDDPDIDFKSRDYYYKESEQIDANFQETETGKKYIENTDPNIFSTNGHTLYEKIELKNNFSKENIKNCRAKFLKIEYDQYINSDDILNHYVNRPIDGKSSAKKQEGPHQNIEETPYRSVNQKPPDETNTKKQEGPHQSIGETPYRSVDQKQPGKANTKKKYRRFFSELAGLTPGGGKITRNKKSKLNSKSKKIQKARKLIRGGEKRFLTKNRLNKFISEDNIKRDYFKRGGLYGMKLFLKIPFFWLIIIKDMGLSYFYNHHYFFAGLETEEIIYFSTYNRKKLLEKIKQIESQKYEKLYSIRANFNLDSPRRYKVEILRRALTYNFDSELKRNQNQPKNLINLGSSLIFLCINYPTQGVREYLKDLELFYIRTTGESPDEFFTKIQAELKNNEKKYTQYKDTYTAIKQDYCLPPSKSFETCVTDLRDSMIYNLIPVDSKYEVLLKSNNDLIISPKRINSDNGNPGGIGERKTSVFKYKQKIKKFFEIFTEKPVQGSFFTEVIQMDELLRNINDYKDRKLQAFGDDEIFNIDNPDLQNFLKQNVHQFKKRDFDEITLLDTKITFGRNIFPGIVKTFLFNLFYIMASNQISVPQEALIMEKVNGNFSATLGMKGGTEEEPVYEAAPPPGTEGQLYDETGNVLYATGNVLDATGNVLDATGKPTYDLAAPRAYLGKNPGGTENRPITTQQPLHQYTQIDPAPSPTGSSDEPYAKLEPNRARQAAVPEGPSGYIALNRKGFPTMSDKSGTGSTGTSASPDSPTNQPSQPSSEQNLYGQVSNVPDHYGRQGPKLNLKALPNRTPMKPGGTEDPGGNPPPPPPTPALDNAQEKAITKLTNKMTETGLRKGGFLAGLIDRQHNYTDFIGKYKVEFEKKYINEEEPYVALFSFYKNYLKENFLTHKYFFNNICCFLEFLIKIEQVGILLFKLKKGEGNTKMSVINIATNDKLLQEIKQKFAKIPQDSLKNESFNNNYIQFAKDCIIKGQNIPSIEDYLNFLNMYYEGGTVDSNFEQNKILEDQLTEIAKVFDTNTINKVQAFDGTKNIEYQEFSKIFEKLEFDIQTRRIVKAFDKKYSTEFYDVLEHETYLSEEHKDQTIINKFFSDVEPTKFNKNQEIFEALSAESEYIRKKNIGMKGGMRIRIRGLFEPSELSGVNPNYENRELPSRPSSPELPLPIGYEPMGFVLGGSGSTLPGRAPTSGPTENPDNTLTSNSQISQKTRDVAQKGQLERGKCFPIYHNCDSFDEAVLHKGLQLVNEAGTRKNLLDSKEFFDFLKKFLGINKNKLEGIIRDEKNKNKQKTQAQAEGPTENTRAQDITGTKKKGAQGITGPENTTKKSRQAEINPSYNSTQSGPQNPNKSVYDNNEYGTTPDTGSRTGVAQNLAYGLLPNNASMKLWKNTLKGTIEDEPDSAGKELPGLTTSKSPGGQTDLFVEEIKKFEQVKAKNPDNPLRYILAASKISDPLTPEQIKGITTEQLKRASERARFLPTNPPSESGEGQYATLRKPNPRTAQNPAYGLFNQEGSEITTPEPDTPNVKIQNFDRVNLLAFSNPIFIERIAEDYMVEQIENKSNLDNFQYLGRRFAPFEPLFESPNDIHLSQPSSINSLGGVEKTRLIIYFYDKITFKGNPANKPTLTLSSLGKKLFDDRNYGTINNQKFELNEKVSRNILKILDTEMSILFTIFNLTEPVKRTIGLTEQNIQDYQKKILKLLLIEDRVKVDGILKDLKKIKSKLEELINIPDEPTQSDFAQSKNSLSEYNFMLLVTGLYNKFAFVVFNNDNTDTINDIIQPQIETFKNKVKLTGEVAGGGKLDFKKKQLFKLIDIDSDEDQEILLKFAEKDFLKKKMKSGNNEFSTDDCEKYTYYDAQEATLPESLNINKSMEDYGFIYYENAKNNIDKKENFVNLFYNNLIALLNWFNGINEGSNQYDKQPNIDIKGNNTYLLLNKTENPNIYEIGYIYEDENEDFIEYTKPGDKIKIDGTPKKLKLSYNQGDIENEYYVYYLCNDTETTTISNDPDITNVKFYDENDTEIKPPQSYLFNNKHLLPNQDIKKITKYEGDNLSTNRESVMPVSLYQDKYVDYILDYNCSNDTTSINFDSTIPEEYFSKPTIHKYLDRNKNSLKPTDFKLSENYSISEGNIKELKDYLASVKSSPVDINFNDIHLLLVEIEIPPTQGEDKDCPLFKTSLLEILCFNTQYEFKKYMYYHFEDFVTKVKKYINSKSSESEVESEQDKKRKETMVNKFLTNDQKLLKDEDVRQELVNIILYFEKKNEEGRLNENPETIQEDRMDIYNSIYINKEGQPSNTPHENLGDIEIKKKIGQKEQIIKNIKILTNIRSRVLYFLDDE